MKKINHYQKLLICIIFCFTTTISADNDPLPSWNEGKSKEAILSFVNKITSKNKSSYVHPAERIAVFDNDGTLWSEQPLYFQLQFAIDRVHQLAPEHPEWKTQQPFKAVLDNDVEALMASGEKGLLEIVMATHAGMTTEEFEQVVSDCAEKEYINPQLVNAERPEAQLNLDNYYAVKGDADNAISAYKKVISLEDVFLPAYVNLADIYRAQGNDVAAEKILKQAIEIESSSAGAHYALGLLYIYGRKKY